MRQRRVLDAAAENPDASMHELAAMVPTATADFVERVLETYGDPAAEDESESATTEVGKSTLSASEQPTDASATDQSASEGRQPTERLVTEQSMTGDEQATDDSTAEQVKDKPTTNGSSTEQSRAESEAADGSHSPPSPDELTSKQREICRAIAAEPEATQRELAAEFGVSASTVSNHVNSIEGFDWGRRQPFVEGLFDDDPESPAEAGETGTEPAELQETLAELSERLSALEEQVEQWNVRASESTFDPNLAHKVVHACIQAERITEEEELQILRTLLGNE